MYIYTIPGVIPTISSLIWDTYNSCTCFVTRLLSQLRASAPAETAGGSIPKPCREELQLSHSNSNHTYGRMEFNSAIQIYLVTDSYI